MSILFGNKGICRYERFARVKKQKLLFTKIRAELKVFNSVEAEINRRSERDSQIRQEMGIVAETDDKLQKRLDQLVLTYIKKMASLFEHLDNTDELD